MSLEILVGSGRKSVLLVDPWLLLLRLGMCTAGKTACPRAIQQQQRTFTAELRLLYL